MNSINDIEKSNNELKELHENNNIPIDESKGTSYIKSIDKSTATFEYGTVTDDMTDEEIEQYIGRISTANNSDIHINNSNGIGHGIIILIILIIILLSIIIIPLKNKKTKKEDE